MKNTIILSLALIIGVSFSSCKKKAVELRSTKIGGCLDPNSLSYNPNSDFDDESCKYAFANQIEITYHPLKDCGSDWDGFPTVGNAKKADLILKFRIKGSNTWLFESSEKTDQTHNEPALWTLPSNIELKNVIYEWIVEDYDTFNSNDLVSQGEFNPIQLAADGKIITIGKNGCNEESQLILYYTVQ